MSSKVNPDPIRLGSDPPPEGSQSADSYEAPTRVGESAYVMLARSMTDEPATKDAASTAITAPPPAMAAGAASSAPPATPAEPEAEDPAVSAPPSRAPPPLVSEKGGGIEFAIAVASFLAVAIPAVLYVIYLR